MGETLNHNTLNPSDIFTRLSGLMDRFGRTLGRIGFGLFVALALGAALVATTFIGLLLAAAAIFLTIAQGWGRRRRRAAGADSQEETPRTLEAHRTADGWVTEVDGRFFR